MIKEGLKVTIYLQTNDLVDTDTVIKGKFGDVLTIKDEENTHVDARIVHSFVVIGESGKEILLSNCLDDDLGNYWRDEEDQVWRID